MAHCGRTMAPSADQPAVLFVLGPSAVGKSYITDATALQLFGSSHNAVILDGEIFRERHAGWCEVVLHGMKSSVLHQDAWTTFKDAKTTVEGSSKPVGISTALKQRILAGAIRDRQNLIVPSCANQPERLAQEMKQLREAGYLMHAVCLWAPLSETRARGEPRSVREGKRWDGKSYDISIATVLKVAREWVKGMEQAGEASCYQSCALWDNTVFPAREVSLDEFANLSTMTHAEADEHAWRLKRPLLSPSWTKVSARAALARSLSPPRLATSTRLPRTMMRLFALCT